MESLSKKRGLAFAFNYKLYIPFVYTFCVLTIKFLSIIIVSDAEKYVLERYAA